LFVLFASCWFSYSDVAIAPEHVFT
jgi:hypothetical protein